MAKKNNELREQIEAITQEKNVLQQELKSKDEKFVQAKAKVDKLQQQFATKENDINKMLGVSICFYNKIALYAN